MFDGIIGPAKQLTGISTKNPPNEWTQQEIDCAYDMPVAKFYARLTEYDLWLMGYFHIDIHGDLRET